MLVYTVSLGRGLHTLSKVGAQVLLEVKVGERLAAVIAEKLGQLGVGVNMTTVLAVLKVVVANILVNLLRNLSASHLSALLAAKERSKLVGDKRGLNKPAGLLVAASALTTRRL